MKSRKSVHFVAKKCVLYLTAYTRKYQKKKTIENRPNNNNIILSNIYFFIQIISYSVLAKLLPITPS